MNTYLLRCASGTATSVIASDTTDYYGGYQFSGVAYGEYALAFGGIS